MKTLFSSIMLLFFLSGCDEKAEPIDSLPEEGPQEQHEKGYIDTH